MELTREFRIDMSKTAGFKLSMDPVLWQTDVLKHVAEEMPWLLQVLTPTVVWKAVDEQRGMGFGALILSDRPIEPMQNTGEYPSKMQSAREAPPVQDVEAERKITIPLIVKDYELAQLDVFIKDKEVFPLTERRVSEALYLTRTFGAAVPDRPNPLGFSPMMDTSVADKLYPPPEAVFGYGSGSGGSGTVSYGADGHKKEDASPELNERIQKLSRLRLSDKIAFTVSPEDRAAFFSFVKTGDDNLPLMLAGNLEQFIRKILSSKPLIEEDAKELTRSVFGANIVRVRGKAGSHGIYEITSVSDDYYEPTTEETDLTGVESKLGFMDDGIREKLLAGDMVIFTMEHKIVEPIVLEDYAVEAEHVAGGGNYILMDRKGDFRVYWVCDKVLELNGKPLDGALLFTDGRTWSLQDKLVGERTETPVSWPESRGIEIGMTISFRYGDKCYYPITITGIFDNAKTGSVIYYGTDVFGHEIFFKIVDGIDQPVVSRGIEDHEIGQYLGGVFHCIPSSFEIMELGQKTSAAEHVDQLQRVFHERVGTLLDRHHANQKRFRIDGKNNRDEADRFQSETLPTGSPDSPRNPDSYLENTLVEIWKAPGDNDTFVLAGRVLEELEHATPQQELSEKEALFTLATLGLSLAQAEALLRRSLEGAIHVANLRPPRKEPLKTAQIDSDLLERIAAKMKTPLWKEAAELLLPVTGPRNPEAFASLCEYYGLRKAANDEIAAPEETVDAVLSLGFVNPENMARFVESVHEFRESEQQLAELLVMVRLGMRGVPEKAVQNALKGLNKVTEALESMASYGQAAFEQEQQQQ
jgi:hypothetical protein